MHRFYSIQPSGQVLPQVKSTKFLKIRRFSFLRFQRIAAAIVFLTCKIFDCPKALQDVVLAFLHLLTGKTETLRNDVRKKEEEDKSFRHVVFFSRLDHRTLSKRFDQMGKCSSVDVWFRFFDRISARFSGEKIRQIQIVFVFRTFEKGNFAFGNEKVSRSNFSR